MASDGNVDFRLKITSLELMTTATDCVTHPIDTFDITQSDMEYRAEGNANIVLALPHRCQVLRLPKILKSDQNSCYSTSKQNTQSKRIFYVYKYISSISAMFEQHLSCQPILVRIEFYNANAFNCWLHNLRPLHRINQHAEDSFDFEYGLLYRDACSLKMNLESMKLLQSMDYDVFAVEIKPKQGWNICLLSESMLNLFGIDESIRDKCRFCAMQYLKVSGQTVQAISKYCPLDLFSGNLPRTKNALRNLIVSPQNNFRVFRNRKLVYSEENGMEDLQSILMMFFRKDLLNSMNEFISLLSRILHYDFVNRIELEAAQAQSTPASETCCCIEEKNVHQKLPRNSILKLVLDFQLLAQNALNDVAQQFDCNPSMFQKLKADNQWPHLHFAKICEKLVQFNRNSERDYDFLNRTLNLCAEEIYEIGATALDCSIMLTFCKVNSEISNSIDLSTLQLNNNIFAINATIFDLDPKLYPKHFMKYIEKTKASYNALRQYSSL